MQKVEKDTENSGADNVHTLTIGELLSEVMPGFMEIMSVPMNGKLAYNVGKNWRCVQKVQRFVHDRNMEEMKKHVELDSNGKVVMSEAVPGQRSAPLYLSEESKKAYFDWYKKFSEEEEVSLEFYPVSQEELAYVQNVKPATITSLSFMFHE